MLRQAGLKSAATRGREAMREAALKGAAKRTREEHSEAARKAQAARSPEAARRRPQGRRDPPAQPRGREGRGAGLMHYEIEQAGPGHEHRPDVGTHAEPERWHVVNVFNADAVPMPLRSTRSSRR